MESQKPLEDKEESDEEDSIESTSSEDSTESNSLEGASDTSTESEGVATMSYILLEEKASKGILDVDQVEKEEGVIGSYEHIEELMQLKMEPSLKQEIIENMLCMDLTKGKEEEYTTMISQFPNLFIISYEEII